MKRVAAVLCLLAGAGLLWFTEAGEVAGAILLGLGGGLGISALINRD